MTDRLPITRIDGPLSVTGRLAHCLNIRLDAVCFHYTLLDVCAEFSFVWQ